MGEHDWRNSGIVGMRRSWANPYASLGYYWPIVTGRRRVNVNFSEQAFRTLETLSTQTGHSMSEVLRDSIAFYRWFTEVRAQGGRILVENRDGAQRELISL